MDHIYCLVFNGSALTPALGNLLFQSAQMLMIEDSRKKRLLLKDIGLTGVITTKYKLGMLGSACGFVFRAEMDWDSGSTKTDFIVRPVDQEFLETKMQDMQWRRMNPGFVPEPATWRN